MNHSFHQIDIWSGYENIVAMLAAYRAIEISCSRNGLPAQDSWQAHSRKNCKTQRLRQKFFKKKGRNLAYANAWAGAWIGLDWRRKLQKSFLNFTNQKYVYITKVKNTSKFEKRCRILTETGISICEPYRTALETPISPLILPPIRHLSTLYIILIRIPAFTLSSPDRQHWMSSFSNWLVFMCFFD